jgi:hypothetical protein
MNMNDSGSTITPIDFTGVLARRWPILVLAGMLGGLAGWLISLGFAPVYQAEAVISIGIDYGASEPLELVVEDRVLDRVAANLTSDEMMGMVLDQLPADLKQSNDLQAPTDLHPGVKLDRRLSQWHLIARHADPMTARAIANAWAHASLKILEDTSAHAWRVAGLVNATPYAVDCVLGESVIATPGPALWDCSVTDADFPPEALEGELQNAVRLSRGMLPVVTYELAREADTPGAPVLWARGVLIFVGMMIGLLFGGGLLFAQTFARFSE